MRWLTAFYFAEGPGIPKDAPKKEGLALIAETAWREGFELMKLNLLFILFALPLVTLPAAIAALMRVALLMADDRNVYLLRDFTNAFRRYSFPASLAGLLVVAATGIPGFAAFAYGRLAADAVFYTPAFVLAAAVALQMAVAGAYLFAFMVSTDAALPRLVVVSLRAAFLRPLPVLAAFAFVSLLWVAHILFYPVSVFMPAAINFSFGALAIAFSVLETVKCLHEPWEETGEKAREAIPGIQRHKQMGEGI